MIVCDQCGRERRPDERDYSPLDLFTPGATVGWYSGDDGEICGEDMLSIFETANGRRRG